MNNKEPLSGASVFHSCLSVKHEWKTLALNGDFILQNSIEANKSIHLSLKDMLGQELFEKNIINTMGGATKENLIHIPDSILSGVYILQIFTDGKYYNYKVVKQWK